MRGLEGDIRMLYHSPAEGVLYFALPWCIARIAVR